jgi:hypothetical protein
MLQERRGIRVKVFALGYATSGCRSQSLLSNEAFSVCVGTEIAASGNETPQPISREAP